MRQRSAIVLAGLLVAAIAAVPIAGMAATGETVAQTNNSTATDANETNASVAPGEQLAGVVNVQEAEIEGEVDERAFGIEVAKAATNDSKAEVVKNRLDSVEQRLSELEQKKQELDEARANGSMSEGRYRAEVAELSAKTQSAKRLANQSENVSKGLPADVLEANGINVTAIQTLQDRAANLSGPEVAEIARSIAGSNVGGPPGDRGPAERPERPEQGGPEERPGDQQMPDGNMTDGEQTPNDNVTDGERMPDGEQTPDDNVTDGEQMPDGEQTPEENTTDGQQTPDGEQTPDGTTPDSEQTTSDTTTDDEQTTDDSTTATPRSGY